MRAVIGGKHRAIRAALSALRSPKSSLPVTFAEDLGKTRSGIRRVTIETERTVIFRSRGERHAVWCPACRAEVQMACVEVAARQIGANELAIYQLIESGELHFAEDADGRVLVCLDSLRG